MNFTISNQDIIFILTINPSNFKNRNDNTIHMTAKVFILKSEIFLNCSSIGSNLFNMNINKGISIFSIHKTKGEGEVIVYNEITNTSPVLYKEININDFILYLDNKDNDFILNNRSNLYILRNSNFRDLKKMITKIEGYNVEVVRGSNQKAHLLSTLDLRLTAYMLAFFDLDFNKLNFFNGFNVIEKERYLPYMTNYVKINKKSHN